MERFERYRELLKSDRSIRRFREDERIEKEQLESLVELTRYCASGRNLQPLRYRIVSSREECERVFPLLGWAGYLKDWPGPVEGERPAAYLVQCIDRELTSACMCDDGLQLQSITLGAAAMGLGCCIIKSFNGDRLREALAIEGRYEPLYVVAIGRPLEKVVIEDMAPGSEDIKYYRTPDATHHVPKRQLPELLI